MFDQIKDLYKLQKEAKEMQKKMKQIMVEGYSDDEDVKIKMNGLQEIESIEIDDELMSVENKKELIKAFIQAVKDAQKRLQKEMAKDMDVSQIKSMLGAS
ncbi:MAG TPA: YbaB/EbfC family nucleoid-associated protein [Candidatus Dojkabacteria bacterium]|nr:YbaB/EbfC family nucleoid-associated protein [Candidatus Dojkabacteria bacterium]